MRKPCINCKCCAHGISYNNFDCLEDGYGINLRPLSDFASEVYRDDLCERFLPKVLDENVYDKVAKSLSAKMHKAMAIIQLKLIGQMVHRHPEYHMEDRNLLEHMITRKDCISIMELRAR